MFHWFIDKLNQKLTCISSDPVMTQFFRGTNFAALTGRSQTSNDLTKVWFSWFQTWTLPLYSDASIQGSLGCKSQHFTRSLLAVKRLLISNRKGWKKTGAGQYVSCQNMYLNFDWLTICTYHFDWILVFCVDLELSPLNKSKSNYSPWTEIWRFFFK